MAVRPVLTWPDPRLSEACAPVEAITDDITSLARDMLDTMYDAPGRGLAAPQIGQMLRLFVMDVTWKEGKPDPMIFVNPHIKTASRDLVRCEEGCLSIPDVTVGVERPTAVTLGWTDLTGDKHSKRFTGFAAVCVQHELDHLDGIVTLDRIDADQRRRIEARYGG
ncbi:peptide deformylase [Actibacterium sp. 188UL27-1]|uniref:peptide deformylase n=1 Tax=Actibacterium sp. 188UL27-1 TaxID=2786961 RepID=UPI00195954FA|nr:peptide deformylase [Actibacterium sp. 188UL27-1]MBM7069114.1 peptide deformylase [Actibacterium sp. 188UL27-1]